MSIRVIDSEAICCNIMRILEERGITPKDVQKALRFDSVQAVYKWISPKTKTVPSLDSLVQLANFLDCEIEDILVMKEINDDNEI